MKEVKSFSDYILSNLTDFEFSSASGMAFKYPKFELGALDYLKFAEEELKEFEAILLEKLDGTRKELHYIMETLSKRNDSGTDNTSGTSKQIEDGADTSERENLSQLAGRLQKYATQLENALIRIKNGTYGVCIDTGKLIPKERLRVVPHTQQTIEAKLKRAK